MRLGVATRQRAKVQHDKKSNSQRALMLCYVSFVAFCIPISFARNVLIALMALNRRKPPPPVIVPRRRRLHSGSVIVIAERKARTSVFIIKRER